jgi:RHS repeat-associated protein
MFQNSVTSWLVKGKRREMGEQCVNHHRRSIRVFPLSAVTVLCLPVFLTSGLFAQGDVPRPPHYIETTVNDVNGTGGKVVARDYIDGLGRNPQSQKKINQTYQGYSTVVSGTEYDELNRPHKIVKPFGSANPDYPLDYIPKKLSSDPEGANSYYNGTSGRADAGGYPFSEIKYNKDPLGGPKMVGSPGVAYSAHSDPKIGHPVKTWYFGVPGDATEINSTEYFDEDGFLLPAFLSDGTITGSDDYLDGIIPDELSETDEDLDYFLMVNKDGNGSYSQSLSDKFGKVLRTWVLHSDGKAPIVARYTYDVLGRVKVETPPETPEKTSVAPSEYNYNPLSQLENKSTPDAGTISYTYDDAGRLQEVIDQLLFDSKFAVSTGSGDDETIQPRLRYEYDDFGRIVTISRYEPSEEAPEQTKWCTWIRNIYDDPEDAREFLNTSAFPEDTELDALLSACTNTRGRLVASIAYDAKFYQYRTGEDEIASVESMYGNKVIDLYSYDDEGRVNHTYKSIPGLDLQLGKWGYDLHGKVVADTIEFGSPLTRIITRYTYDVEGRLNSIYRDNKLYETYTYDDLGRLVKKEFMPGTADSRSVEYAYTINEWTKKIEASNSAFSEELCYESNDIADALLTGKSFSPQYNGGISRAKAATGASGSGSELDLLYKYDKAGRLVKVANNKGYTGSDEFDAEFEYQNDGRFAEKHEGPGQAAWGEYTYHSKEGTTAATNKIKSIPGSGKGDATNANFIYDPNGNMVLDKAKKMAVEYDWSDMPVNFYLFEDAIEASIDTWEEVKTLYAGNWTRKVTMTYDASGNRVKKETFEPEEVPEEPQSLQFTDISNGSMLEVLPSGSITSNRLLSNFNEDAPDGALVSESNGDVRLAVSDLAMQITGAVVDENGLPVENGDLTTTYEESDPPQFAINAAGQGLALSGSMEPQVPISGVAYVDDSHVFVKGDAGDPYELSYVNFGDGVSLPDNSFEFHVKDHLGSVRVVLTENGTVKEASAYLAYGKEKPITSTAEPSRQKYAGTEFDQDGVAEDGATQLTNGIDLNYFGARYYDPEIGAWTSTDPVDEFWNSYSYVGGDPVNFTDPSGMFSVPAKPMSMLTSSIGRFAGVNSVGGGFANYSPPVEGSYWWPGAGPYLEKPGEPGSGNNDGGDDVPIDGGQNDLSEMYRLFNINESDDGLLTATEKNLGSDGGRGGTGVGDGTVEWGGRDNRSGGQVPTNQIGDFAKRNGQFITRAQKSNAADVSRVKIYPVIAKTIEMPQFDVMAPVIDDGTISRQMKEMADRDLFEEMLPLYMGMGGIKIVESVPIGKLLQGTGQIPALLRNPNLKGIDTKELLTKTIEQAKKMLTKKQFKQLMKHFEGRDLRHGK